MKKLNRIIEIDLPSEQSTWLWGARKTGKSTYLRQSFPASAYFDLLDSDLFLAYTKRPALFREHVVELSKEQKEKVIIVDEVQKVPMLLDEIHLLIEKYELSFILCGSSARKLRLAHTNKLGGRAWRYEMYPFVFPELSNFDLLHALQWGLIPSHYLSSDPKRSLQSYVTDYLQLEIQQESLTRNLPAFARFLEAASYSANQLVNYSTVARDVGVDSKTIKEYFQILVDTLLGHFLYPFSLKKKRQEIVSTPKFYFFDVGLAGFLRKRTLSEPKGDEAGWAFENFIFMELIAYRSYRNRDFKLSFWRTKAGLEVDFILQEQDKCLAIEAKISQRVDKRDFKGLVAFSEDMKECTSYVVCLEERARLVEIGDCKIHVVPYKQFLKQLWEGELF